MTEIETLSDIKLANTALVIDRWPMPAEKRKDLIGQLFDIALNVNGKTNQRKVIMASRTLIAADRLNILENQQAESGGFLEGLLGQGGQVNIQLVMKELREDPDYEEFARSQMLKEAAAALPAPSHNGNGHKGNGNGH